MMVSPDEMSASSAPSIRPLKSCEKKFGQLIIGTRLAHLRRAPKHRSARRQSFSQVMCSCPSLQLPSGFGVALSPGTTSMMSKKSSGPFIAAFALPRMMTTGTHELMVRRRGNAPRRRSIAGGYRFS